MSLTKTTTGLNIEIGYYAMEMYPCYTKSLSAHPIEIDESF